MENPIKMDDLGVSLFSETPIWFWIQQKKNAPLSGAIVAPEHRMESKTIWYRDHQKQSRNKPISNLSLSWPEMNRQDHIFPKQPFRKKYGELVVWLKPLCARVI